LTDENAAVVLNKKFDNPNIEVFAMTNRVNKVILATQLLPCQKINLRRSEY